MSGQHARLSASSAHRWLNCAGSVNASEGLGSASLPAARGTFGHDIAATCISNLTKEPRLFLGAKQHIDGFDVEADQDLIDAVTVYVDTVLEDEQEGDKTWIEMPLLTALQSVDKDLGGTADRVRYRPGTKHLRVFDFKSGAGVYVEADDNEQMKTYALGAMLAVGLPVSDVTVTIVQPAFEGARPVRDWHFKGYEILEFVADLQESAIASRRSDATLVAGDWCKFCPAARTCPELEKRQHALTAVAFGPIVDYAKLAMALTDIPMVKERIKALEEFAYTEAMKGADIPGFKLVDKIARRKWKDEAAVVEWAQKIALDPYAPREVLSPAQLEKKVAETAPKGKKKEAGKVLEPFVEKVSSGLALVPVSDERKPASRVAEISEFPVLIS